MEMRSRSPWQNTTHDWASTVDLDHLRHIRRHPALFAPGGVRHLILEVVAYAADEAGCKGGGHCRIALHSDGSVCVADDGRGTDTRLDDRGRAVKKPVISTKDLRFFDHPDAQILPDGHPRRGMSVVAALSDHLEHTNRRSDGAWIQRYERGIAVTDLIPLPHDRTMTGTTIRFLASPSLTATAALTPDDLTALTAAWPRLTLEVHGRHPG
ncbi:ATP-binding protein [Streptomyces sp. V3I7]|uniref:ATP-binding protein n=1 Tax=Streptomyces sp. V3I7 TaxID=3042278 RepID=UPI002789596E|nr:ATP-binding protein [Streptomyces sp. V3I7]MDQ0988825.1 topoisomerase-4 subunit B [Streptomyces sp. V3I7]